MARLMDCRKYEVVTLISQERIRKNTWHLKHLVRPKQRLGRSRHGKLKEEWVTTKGVGEEIDLDLMMLFFAENRHDG